jgi:hypothetical protein
MMNRRVFTQALAFFTSAPKTLEHTGIKRTVSTDEASLVRTSPIGDDSEKSKLSLIERLMSDGLPDWLMDELIEERTHVEYLDPDIACFRSFSTVGKVHAQRQRNIKEFKENMFSSQMRKLKLSEWERVNKVYFW